MNRRHSSHDIWSSQSFDSHGRKQTMNNSNIAGIMAILALCVGHRATVVASTTDFNVCYSGSNCSDGSCSSRIGETHRCSVLAPAKKEKVTKCIRGSDTAAIHRTTSLRQQLYLQQRQLTLRPQFSQARPATASAIITQTYSINNNSNCSDREVRGLLHQLIFCRSSTITAAAMARKHH